MIFLIHLHEPGRPHSRLVGRATSAAEALGMMRRWRHDHPRSWVEIRRVPVSPLNSAA